MRGWDFSWPARKYSRAGRGVSLRPTLLIFSLVALPFPAPGGGRAPSPRPPPEAARFTSHNQNQKQQGAPRRDAPCCFWLRGWDFSWPARKYSRAGRGVSLRPTLLIFSLVALPFPAPGGGRAPSPRPPPEAARFTSHNQNQKQQGAPRRDAPCCFWLRGWDLNLTTSGL